MPSADDQGLLDILTGRRGGPDGFIPGEWFGGGGEPASNAGSSTLIVVLCWLLKAALICTVLVGYVAVRYVLPAIAMMLIGLLKLVFARR